VSPLTILRRIVKPAGQHRAPRNTGQLLRPAESLLNDIAYCPAEERNRLHAFLRTGGRVCWTCRTVTTDPTPPGGAE
jgi:hypothetical protein